jgi:hypothetical protein
MDLRVPCAAFCGTCEAARSRSRWRQWSPLARRQLGNLCHEHDASGTQSAFDPSGPRLSRHPDATG